MTSDRARWGRVKAIFDAALAVPEEERDAVVRDACGDDAALAEDVASLLAADAGAGAFAERPARAVLESFDAASDAGGPALAAGLELGAYRVLGPLDAGGMGEVYRAFDTRLRREVAVKVLPAAWSGDADRVERLEEEARLLAALNHPNIATIHGLEVAGPVRAVVMELIEGPTLAERLAGGPLPVADALAFAGQIADALAAAHRKGIVHRDLKPANVKIAPGGTIKVLDFGLAVATAADHAEPDDDARAADRAPARVAVAGTPSYMSPEHVRGETLDERADVWAFGCVLYEMLTGRRAFAGETVGETLTAILEREPEWARLPRLVPPHVRRALRRCLHKDPRRRLQDIADVRIEIEDGGDPAETAAAAAAEANRRRARVFAIATAVLALACAAALLAWLRRGPAAVPDRRAVDIATAWMPDPWAFAVSPDGRRLAYVAEHQGQPTLWVRSLVDIASAHALPGTERARGPFWSPDSRSVGFFADSDLKRTEASGGAVRTVTYALAGSHGTWAADGTILFASTPVPVLRRVDAAGGPVLPATAMPAAAAHRHPQFLPDGRRFLFFVGGAADVRGAYLGTLDGPGVTRLVASDTHAAYLAPHWLLFVRQGTLLAQRVDLSRAAVAGEPVTVADSVAFDPISGSGGFSVADAGVIAYRTARPSVTRLAWFDRAGRPLGTFGAAEHVGLSTFVLSPDGRRVAAERTVQRDTDVWLLDEVRQRRLTHDASGAVARVPVWSRDGSRLAYELVGARSLRLSMRSLAGGADETLLDSLDVKVPCDWSPDGRHVMYYRPDPVSGTDLWLVSVQTRVPVVFLKTPANELWGQFSPDGRWVAYQSNTTGRYEIYLRPAAGSGEPVVVSTQGGVYPRWARDGTALYYIAPDASLMAAAIRKTGTGREAAVPVALFRTRRVGGGANVIGRGHQYDVAPDGRFLINVDADQVAPPLTLLLDWRP
jgi:Tol biopolymer transport system component